jgi:hypothetical protein
MLEQGFEAFEKEQMNGDALEKRDLDDFVFDQEGDPENKTLNKNDNKKDIVLKPKSFENPNFDKSKNIE